MATHGHVRNVATVSLALVGCSGFWGCNIGKGYSDFASDVTNPEQVVIDGPGTKIADGQVSKMLVDPWGEGGSVVLGFQYQKDGPHLRMQPFDGRKGCNAGIAYSFRVFKPPANEPQLIPYVDGNATLHFSDHDCNVVYGDFKNAELPRRNFDSPPGFVVESDHQLLDINPYTKKTRVLANNLLTWSRPKDSEEPVPIWYIADGQFVVLDEAREERVRIGKDVTAVWFEASDPTRGLFLLDGGNLTHYAEATGTTPKTIANDACQAKLGSYGISYFSPCAEARLVIADLETGVKLELDSGVSQLMHAQLRVPSGAAKEGAARAAETDVEAIYTKRSSTDSDDEELWLKPFGESPRLWRTGFSGLVDLRTANELALIAIVDSNGTSGRLVRITVGSERTLCDTVATKYPIATSAGGWLLMTELEDGFGNLTHVTENGEQLRVAEHVSARNAPRAPFRDPQLTDISDGRYFDLRAYSLRNDTGAPVVGLVDNGRIDALTTLGTNVPDGKFDFFRNMTAIGYLDKYDSETDTGTLSVYQTRIGAKSSVASNVNEFTELLWPYEGVLYSVKQGDQYSLWAARAKP